MARCLSATMRGESDDCKFAQFKADRQQATETSSVGRSNKAPFQIPCSGQTASHRDKLATSSVVMNQSISRGGSRLLLRLLCSFWLLQSDEDPTFAAVRIEMDKHGRFVIGQIVKARFNDQLVVAFDLQ